MTPHPTVPARFHRVLVDVAADLKIRGRSPELWLAGRFGIRRFLERHVTSEKNLEETPWLDRAARLRRLARDVSRALTDAGIRHFFFKGIALVGRLYQLDDRELADVDLVVDPAQRSAALAVLHAMGFADMMDAQNPGPAVLRPGVTMQRIDPYSGDPEEGLLDVHWGLEPVTSLLPGDSLDLPEAVWKGLETDRGLPTPNDEHHLALILHHLVRHDFVHVRGLLDFALLWDALPKRGGRELWELAGHLEVRRALRAVGRVLVNDLNVFPLRGVRLGLTGWRGRAMQRRLSLRTWLARAAWAARIPEQHVIVSVRRAWQRMLVVDDSGAAARLLGELVAPPGAYLHWRWPRASDAGAWRRHVVSAVRGPRLYAPGRVSTLN